VGNKAVSHVVQVSEAAIQEKPKRANLHRPAGLALN